MFYILYFFVSLVILIPVLECVIPRLRKSFNFLIYTITIKVVTLMLLPLGLNKPIDEVYLSIHPMAFLTPVLIGLVIIYHYKRYKQFVNKSSQILSGK